MREKYDAIILIFGEADSFVLYRALVYTLAP